MTKTLTRKKVTAASHSRLDTSKSRRTALSTRMRSNRKEDIPLVEMLLQSSLTVLQSLMTDIFDFYFSILPGFSDEEDYCDK